MSNKVFIFLVVILSLLIICSLIWLVTSVSTYKQMSYPDEKPSVLVDSYNGASNSNDNINSSNKEDKEDKPAVTTPNNDNKENTSNINADDYILPSDSREITKLEIMSFDYDKLNKAYNEIFARHGHDFKTDELKQYFMAKAWYKPIEGKTVGTSDLSELERENLQLIKARIDEIKE